MKGYYKILVINPGSMSTKIALFHSLEAVFSEDIQHRTEDLARYKTVFEQKGYRAEVIENFLKTKKVKIEELDAVVGRGGFVRPVESGVFLINEKMLEDLKNSKQRWGREHASNLGAPLSLEIADRVFQLTGRKIPAFIVDPVVVDEMEPIAKISGVPEIERKSIHHALNLRAVGRLVAQDLGKDFFSVNLIGAHMGGGISVAVFKNGRGVDAPCALLGYGPFSPQRAGTMALESIIEMAFSGKYDKASLVRKLTKESGLIGYLGTDSGIEIEKRIRNGDKKAELVYHAMAYNIAKEIGAMAAVLEGKVDAIFLTGGLAHSTILVEWIKKYVSFIAPVKVYPGERELFALASGAYRVLTGQEIPKEY